MVVGNHRRFLQYTDNANEESNHSHISDIFKRPGIIVYATIGLLFLTFLGLSLCRYLRSKRDAPAPPPPRSQPQPQEDWVLSSSRVRANLKPFQKLVASFCKLGYHFHRRHLIRVVGPSSATISNGQDIEVVIHHGGKLVNDGKLRFMFDPDVWSYFMIVGVMKSLGYQGFKDMWYFVGGASVLDDKLESLCDAMHMVNLARLNGEVHVFVIHPVSEPEVIHMLEYVRNDEGQVEERGDMVDVGSEQQQMGEQQEMGEKVQLNAVMDEEVDGVQQVEVEEVQEVREVEEVEQVEEVGGVLEEMGGVDGQVQVEEVGGDGQHEGEEENEVEIRSWNSSFENGSGDGNTEWMEELVDVNVGCDIDDDIQANFEGNVEVEVQSMSNESSGACDSVSSDSIFDVNVEGGNGRGLSDDEWEFEQLVSGVESDEEDTYVEGYGTFPTFVLPKSKCPWRLYCGYMKAVKTWQLRTMLDNHTCSREFNLKLIDSKENIRENPTFKGVDIREKVQRKYNIGISRCMAYRAKNIATKEIDGSFKDQYKRLYDYAHELLAKNPGSTVKLNVEDVGGEVAFKIFYVCLKAYKDSFMSCRPIIGLDGAFLEGKYGGELLTTMGRDGNEQMLPIAYCVVEVENKDWWRWFLELLVDDLGGPEICSSFTFMSDQQKGLELSKRVIRPDPPRVGGLKSDPHIGGLYFSNPTRPKPVTGWQGLRHAIDELLPRVDQRFCVRHMYSNFRKKYPGKNLKRLMWRAATTTHPQTWEMEMRNIRALNEDAYKHLIAIPPRHWSRSRFTERAKCDTLVNNMSEGFNNVLLSTKSKPIITLLEEIRLYLMQRWAKNRSSILSFTGSICAKILSRFRKESQLTKHWIPSWSGNKLFEVRHMYNNGDKFVVNIDDSLCTCRTWMMTGIPCCHSLAAMKFLNIDGEKFIDSCYFKSTYEETYSTIIYPINGAKMWNITPYPDVSPPDKRVLPGRPKRKRRLEQWEMRKDESRMTKSGLRKRCRICRQHGHNRTRCPSATQPGTVPGTSAIEAGTAPGTSATQATTSTQQSEIAHESQPQPGTDKERLLAGFEWKGHMDESNIHRNERDLETPGEILGWVTFREVFPESVRVRTKHTGKSRGDVWGQSIVPGMGDLPESFPRKCASEDKAHWKVSW
ncbi:hypothetical protein V8G54_035451 [Vigna mungo]|uniref:SWIM-type domain-containing protein n=1 Tax=Vigna mungo TaxID=3915 RepID=A0AAQ3REL2_VIGMU